MQDLTVIGVENGAILVSSDEGIRYRLAVDDTLRSKLGQAERRKAVPPAAAGSSGNRKVAPREIQAHIRAGLSAEDVAAITGASRDYIEKFERPVLAEREYIIESALNVAVHTAADPDPMTDGSTFGSAIRERLQALGATEERWASWKEATGEWIIKLSFRVGPIDHDARWGYEPKRAALAPLNSEANTLSQQGEMPGALIPRLRAVGGDERIVDSSRFDSGAFDLGSPSRGTAPQPTVPPFGRSTESSPEVAAAAIKRAPADEVASTQTADLLDALRRRRGERESAASWSDDDGRTGHAPAGSGTAPTGAVSLLDLPLGAGSAPAATSSVSSSSPAAPSPAASSPSPAGPSPARGGILGDSSSAPARSGGTASSSARATQPLPAQPSSAHPRSAQRRGRPAMPSWDEIVFGARSEDDPA